jgi:diguanylate cyclase (GGDEF)-like protein
MLSKLTSNGLFRLPGAGAQRRMLVLAFAAFAAVAAVALCSVIVIVQTRSSIQAQAFRDQAAVGQSYALVVQEYLDGSRSVLEGLAQVPAVRAPLNLDAIRPELRGIPQEMDVERRAAIAGTILGSGRVHTMVMVAPGGQLYMVEPYASQLAFPTPKLLTPPIERALATGQTVFSDVLINALTHTPSVALQVPIKDDDGVVLGLLGTTLDLGRLAEVAKGVRPGQTGSVMLVDRHGLPIVYSDTARVSAATPLTEMPLVQEALAGRTGPFAYYDPLTNQDELGTAVALDNGWFAMVTQSQAEAYASLNQATATLLIVLGVVVAALLAAGILLAFSIVMRARLAARTAEHERAEEALEHQTMHDALTGLPNRALFSDRLDQALARAEQQDQTNSVAVLFLDIDNLRLINDSLDHAAGDRLLIIVGQRIMECVGPSDTVARLGSDEFAILLENLADAGAAVACAQRIQDRLRLPLLLNDHELFPMASIGIAVSSPESHVSKALFREADAAMVRAKTRGNSYEMFDLSMANRAAERLALESDLHRALERGEFRVHYQPIFSLGDHEQRIVEVEALVRWQHPVRGLISPIDFIPVAEETGLIVPLGQWVLVEACRQAARWRVAYPGRALTMGVNLSARQFQRPELLADIRDALETTGLDPHGLKLEITESVIMQDAEATTATLVALKELGIRLAIDDFGTGYSSLSYLKRFPVDTLKIDRSFVDGLGEDAQDTAIVRSIVALAKALGLSVTGEGIETAIQSDQLRELNCDRGQGYLFARPQPAELIEQLFITAADDRLRAA